MYWTQNTKSLLHDLTNDWFFRNRSWTSEWPNGQFDDVQLDDDDDDAVVLAEF